MKVLLLGGKGFLGSSLIAQANKKKVTIYGTSRLAVDKKNIIQVDVKNFSTLKGKIAEIKPDVIVWSLMCNDNEMELIHTGLNNLLTVIKPEIKLIFISTDAVFTEGLGNYKESDTIGFLPNDAPLSVYVNAKHTGEQLIRHLHNNHIIVRIGPLYGDRNNIEKRTNRIIRLMEENQEIKAATNIYRTFTHVNDLSNAILELIYNEYTGTLHIGPKQRISYFTFYERRLKQLGIHTTITPYEIDTDKERYVSLDTSLNTQKANNLIKTTFQII